MFNILENGIFNSGDQNKIKHQNDEGVLNFLELILKKENIKKLQVEKSSIFIILIGVPDRNLFVLNKVKKRFNITLIRVTQVKTI
jgi:hypothetical protein